MVYQHIKIVNMRLWVDAFLINRKGAGLPLFVTRYKYCVAVHSNNTLTATSAVMSFHENLRLVPDILQRHLNKTEAWLRKWRIKANRSNSTHITFTLRKEIRSSVWTLTGSTIPQDKYICFSVYNDTLSPLQGNPKTHMDVWRTAPIVWLTSKDFSAFNPER